MFCAMVTTNFFATLGVSPILGRDFVAGEDLPEGQGPTVALLSYNFWRRDFCPRSADRRTSICVSTVSRSLVGVLPRNFEFGPAGVVPIWVPTAPEHYETTARGGRWLNVIARLAPGADAGAGAR